jgi:hypothetical protein
MLVRLRAGILGLLGLVAAVGLGLVAFVSQQGWPDAFNSPLPEEPAPLVRNDAISLPPSLERDEPATAPGVSGRPSRGQDRERAPVANLTSDLTVSRQVAKATPPAVPPGQPDDASSPAPPPAPDPESPSAATPAPPPTRPAPAESTSVPVAAESDDVSSGGAAKSKRKSYGRPSKAPGPPPWAGQDDDASDEQESYDKGDYEEPDYDDRDYEDDDSDYEEYDDDWDDDDHDHGRRGRRDWDGD